MQFGPNPPKEPRVLPADYHHVNLMSK